MAKSISLVELNRALSPMVECLVADDVGKVGKETLAAAVRISVEYLAQIAPGKTVELRIPPFIAVQFLEGPPHSRGAPANVVEMSPITWLRLIMGLIDFDLATSEGLIHATGLRREALKEFLPLNLYRN